MCFCHDRWAANALSKITVPLIKFSHKLRRHRDRRTDRQTKIVSQFLPAPPGFYNEARCRIWLHSKPTKRAGWGNEKARGRGSTEGRTGVEAGGWQAEAAAWLASDAC
eukprot:2722823-Rhodomonas_salina.5